ncbi:MULTISPECIES: hypothetical protein [Mammaliicoccus]|uniref:Phage head-tail adapter protein n=1 Tax=Mammaliicoccus sciuri TaxID=1296 RepID=A0AAW5LHI4_MAMSC|nr:MULTISPECIES: hypothetical protein [Mammaliicoccus]MCD5141247.1 hypothetical protein [Mammaliicoccus sciuri]MCQ9302696.1 hypothetical protein [Mammaliicoccus sciuri]MDT0746466.1 hypothetical protein [Mammaliicoccus sciuri]MDT0751416.1 hypothetical protein [Mammaliicoccus sciuri]MDU0266334.1 hypothetical protein [Mammaliicoccus sciuri]
MQRMNKMHDIISFFDIVQNGPEPGGTMVKVFDSFAEIYEPSQKDVQLGNLESSTVNITVIIRNAYPEFVPTVNQQFEVLSGIYNGMKFDIKHISPKDNIYLKVVGGQKWE